MELFRQGIKNGGTDTYYTPLWVTEKLPLIFGGKKFLDPCPGTRRIIIPNMIVGSSSDGLAMNWNLVSPFSFVNPPFSEMSAWLDKVSLEIDQGHSSVWFSKLDYRTRWYEKLEEIAGWIAPVKGYVCFEKEDFTTHPSATFQTCFVTFGKKSADLRLNIKKQYAGKLAKRF